jgi:hypothetical protein
MLPDIARIPLTTRLEWAPADVARWSKEMALACANAAFAFHDPVFCIAPEGDTQDEMFLKACDDMFWRRAATKRLRIEQERLEHLNKLIGKGSDFLYSGESARAWSKNKKESNERFMRNSVVFDHSTGTSVALADVAKTEEERKARYYTFLQGIQTLAAEADTRWAMLTITLPPEYHPNPGTRRPGHVWNGCTADESHKVIAEGWKRVRAVLAKKGITLSGVRTEEPQKDGTPHWHIAFFYKDDEQLGHIARAVLQQFPAGLRICRGRPGKGKKLHKTNHQFQTLRDFDAGKYHRRTDRGAQCQIDVGTLKTGDAEKDAKIQTFASYVLKYVAKSVGVDTDEAADLPAQRVREHRETYSIRQIQFFGVPVGAITCWDLFRQVDLTERDPGLQAPPGIAALAALTQLEKGQGITEYLRSLGGLSIAPVPARCTVSTLKKETVTKYRGKGFKLTGLQYQDAAGASETFVIKHGEKQILRTQAATALANMMSAGDSHASASFYDAAVAASGGLVQLELTVTADTLSKKAAVADVTKSHTVIAAAGSGKTYLLVERAKHLVSEGVHPGSIVVATFTREAAENIATRLEKSGVHGVQVGTMHSLSGKWLHAHGVAAKGFDDAIEKATEIAKPMFNILLDEAQDLSPAQWLWARRWAATLFSVGDDRQAVYAWRGAATGGLFDQARLTSVNRDLFAEGGEIDLNVNRRSSEAIVAFGNAIASGNRVAASLRSGGDVTRFKASNVDQEIAELLEWARTRTGTAAVLVRTNSEAAKVKAEFVLAGVKMTVMTVHASKGLEWDDVALSCGARKQSEEGDEAKEVFYVASTRARNNLHITSIGQLPEILHNSLALCKGRAP